MSIDWLKSAGKGLAREVSRSIHLPWTESAKRRQGSPKPSFTGSAKRPLVQSKGGFFVTPMQGHQKDTLRNPGTGRELRACPKLILVLVEAWPGFGTNELDCAAGTFATCPISSSSMRFHDNEEKSPQP